MNRNEKRFRRKPTKLKRSGTIDVAVAAADWQKPNRRMIHKMCDSRLRKRNNRFKFSFLLMTTMVRGLSRTKFIHSFTYFDWHMRKSSVIIVFVLSFLSQMLTDWNCFIYFFSSLCHLQTHKNDKWRSFHFTISLNAHILRVIHANEMFSNPWKISPLLLD